MDSNNLDLFALELANDHKIAFKILIALSEAIEKKITKEILLSSISISMHSDGLSVLKKMKDLSIISEENGFYSVNCEKSYLIRLGYMLKGMAIYTTQNQIKNDLKIVLSMPRSPSELEKRLKEPTAPMTVRIADTKETFNDLAYKAKDRFVVMTPFLDDSGAQYLLSLFNSLPPGVKMILILRFLSNEKRHSSYPTGYIDIKGDLNDLGVKIYNYSLKRDQSNFLETFHAKVVLADSDSCYIGSSNFNRSSFENSLEMGMVLKGDQVQLVSKVIDSIIEISEKIN